jgi:hypothetical protein
VLRWLDFGYGMVGREETVDGVQQCHPTIYFAQNWKFFKQKNRKSPLIRNIRARSMADQPAERPQTLQKFTLFAVVILTAKVRYQLFAHHVPQSVLQLFELDEKIMFWI